MDHGHRSRYRSLSQHQIGTIIRFLLFCLYMIYTSMYIYIYSYFWDTINYVYTPDIDLVFSLLPYMLCYVDVAYMLGVVFA